MPDPNRHTALDIDTLLRRRRLLMVGGKGGVGKTTVASALALRAASLERRVLLVSTDPAHSLADAFDREIGDRETDLAANLTGLEIDPDSEVDAHLERVRAQMARFAGADPAQPAAAGCADEADVTAPTAIAVTGEGTAVWAGETLTTISG